MNIITNNHNLNFTGSFVVKGKLSSQNKRLFEEFKKYYFDGKSNESIVSKKSYDIFVSKSPTSGKLILFSKFKYLQDEPELNISSSEKKSEVLEKTKLILVLDPSKSVNNDSTSLFRKRLDNFEKDKDYYSGFNSKLEYWIKYIKNFFSKS